MPKDTLAHTRSFLDARTLDMQLETLQQIANSYLENVITSFPVLRPYKEALNTILQKSAINLYELHDNNSWGGKSLNRFAQEGSPSIAEICSVRLAEVLIKATHPNALNRDVEECIVEGFNNANIYDTTKVAHMLLHASGIDIHDSFQNFEVDSFLELFTTGIFGNANHEPTTREMICADMPGIDPYLPHGIFALLAEAIGNNFTWFIDQHCRARAEIQKQTITIDQKLEQLKNKTNFVPSLPLITARIFVAGLKQILESEDGQWSSSFIEIANDLELTIQKGSPTSNIRILMNRMKSLPLRINEQQALAWAFQRAILEIQKDTKKPLKAAYLQQLLAA